MVSSKIPVAAAFAGGVLLTAAVAGTAWAVATSTTATDIGADNAIVSTCDSSWDLAFGEPVYDETDGRYEFTTVDFSNVASPSCDNQTIAVTVFNSSGASLGEGDAVIAASSGTITLSAGVSASDATGTASVIYE